MKVALLTTDSREHFKDYGNPQPYFGTAPEALLDGFKMLPNQIEVHVISCLQQSPVSSPEKLADNIYYHALQVPNIGWMKTGYSGCSRAVRRKLREIQPDIVHGQGTERDCAISAARSRHKFVLTLHGVLSTLYPILRSEAYLYYTVATILEKYSVKRAAGVVCISESVERAVRHLTRKSWLIPNAIRSEFLKHKHFVPRPITDVPHLVNVGMVSPLKRQKELLELLIPLRAKFPFKITFVGGIDTTSPYARDFIELLHTTQSQFHDFQHVRTLDCSTLRDTFDSADALVHFSMEESFCLVLAEARARQMAIFTTEVGAAKAICRSGQPDCFLCRVDKGLDLQLALGNWLERHRLLDSRPDAPNKHIKASMSPAAVAAKHLKLYSEVLACP